VVAAHAVLDGPTRLEGPAPGWLEGTPIGADVGGATALTVFIGHLPAGYLASTALVDRTGLAQRLRRRLLAVGLAASVAPDLDLLWFYLVSDRQVVHHAFCPHLPGAWLLAGGAAALALSLARAPRPVWLGIGLVLVNVGIHLVLDTIVGGVRWGWPVTETEYRLFTVTARYRPWYVNFFLHWTFALELLVVALAWWQFGHRRAGHASQLARATG
jgi:inner membrane protein